jgi:hypothetical protein
MLPGSTGSPSSACFTGFRVFRDNRPGKWLLWRGSRCCTTTIAGNLGSISPSSWLSATSPPADAPMAINSHFGRFRLLDFSYSAPRSNCTPEDCSRRRLGNLSPSQFVVPLPRPALGYQKFPP